IGSYHGALATERLKTLGPEARRAAEVRESRVRAEARRLAGNYPTPFRDTILRATQERGVDPRLMLSIMRQESSFNPTAKSPAAARGLMQLTADTAAVYAPRVRLTVREDDLYRPEVSILLASEYLAELFRLFPNLPEAVAASYNGGEDNMQRWVRRAGHRDPGVVTSEVGFSESKDYVAKVMSNYRAYRLLYTEDLRPRR
ncbi:MAG TPA: lytic transglycosylase domain-containing protein, partial [Pyrinomonadaceae bacterium]